jgi:tripartite-type tricarboxylate transporter receptor subunit TctC
VLLPIIGTLAAQLVTNAGAAEFPDHPITLLVGLAPGGVTDVMARVYAEAVSKTLRQAVVVENRPAASGAVAASALQHAPPDGYTLLLFSGAQNATVPAMEPSAPYDPVNGAAPITLLFNLATIIAVPNDSAAKTLADLVAIGKQKPGGLNFGSPGLGTPSHLMSAKLVEMTKTPAQFVQYRGGAPMMSDLIGARLDAAAPSTPLSKASLLAQRIRAVAIDGPKRWTVIADVPTLQELGLGAASVAGWFGVAAAPGTPPEIIAVLHDAFVTAAGDPTVLQRIEENGLTVATSSPEQMAQLMAKAAAEMKELVKELGLVQP